MKRIYIVALPIEINNEYFINGDPVYFSGVGKINAAMTATKACLRRPEEIINIGSCGSIKHSPGDVIEIGEAYQDIDGTPLCEYGITPFENDKTIHINTNSLFSCFTTDYFVDLSQKEKYSKNYLNMLEKVDVFDMECFALAKVCNEFDIPFRSIKWVSDNGNGNDWKENCKINFSKVKNML
jgi:adenosylhomocysteine nucleosidase